MNKLTLEFDIEPEWEAIGYRAPKSGEYFVCHIDGTVGVQKAHHDHCNKRIVVEWHETPSIHAPQPLLDEDTFMRIEDVPETGEVFIVCTEGTAKYLYAASAVAVPSEQRSFLRREGLEEPLCESSVDVYISLSSFFKGKS